MPDQPRAADVEHDFASEEWSYNDERHYRVCDCGAKQPAETMENLHGSGGDFVGCEHNLVLACVPCLTKRASR